MKTLHQLPVLSLLLLFVGSTLLTTPAIAQEKAPDPNENPEAYDAWKRRQISPAEASQRAAAARERVATPQRLADGDGLLVPRDGSFTALSRNDDGSSSAISLSFTFNLYGTTYSQVYVNTNGNLTFTNSLSTYDPDGFPISQEMVAGFWADVDTRSGGQIYYKVESNRLIVIWDGVGYYDENVDKLNTFEIILSDGTDPVVGMGNTVALSYADMQWTTGSVTPGYDGNGFGGSGATVGVNKGGGSGTFAQIGRFNQPGTDYDGPFNTTDGVDYLDERDFFFNTSGSSSNLPPVASNFSDGDVFEVAVGATLNETLTFISPEDGQTTSIVVDAGGLANFSASTTDGNPASADLTFTPDASQVGDHPVTLTATDDGSPSQSTTDEVILRVTGGPGDTSAPVCGDFTIERDGSGAGTAVVSSASDPESGIDELTFNTLENLTGFYDTGSGRNGGLAEGASVDLDPTAVNSVEIGGDRVDFDETHFVILVEVTNGAGLTSTCDPVIETIPSGIPEGFALKGNYPNPFSEQTTIEFRLPEAAQVTIEVYDMLGRKVATLVDGEEMAASSYELRWDGTAGPSGQRLSSGVYVYRIEAGSHVDARKMTLIR